MVLWLKNFNGDYLIIWYMIFNKRNVWVNDWFRKLNINFEEKKIVLKYWEIRRIMYIKWKFINEKIVENLLFVSEKNKIVCVNYCKESSFKLMLFYRSW